MPEVSRFYGIVIRFYYREHPPEHFHAIYGEHEALVEIQTGRIVEGYLPPKALQLVNEWRSLHLEELAEAWRRSREELPLKLIEPLE
jgi:hypothetical protein